MGQTRGKSKGTTHTHRDTHTQTHTHTGPLLYSQTLHLGDDMILQHPASTLRHTHTHTHTLVHIQTHIHPHTLVHIHTFEAFLVMRSSLSEPYLSLKDDVEQVYENSTTGTE